VKSEDITPRTVERNKQIVATMEVEPTIALAIVDPPITLAKVNPPPTTLRPSHQT